MMHRILQRILATLAAVSVGAALLVSLPAEAVGADAFAADDASGNPVGFSCPAGTVQETGDRAIGPNDPIKAQWWSTGANARAALVQLAVREETPVGSEIPKPWSIHTSPVAATGPLFASEASLREWTPANATGVAYRACLRTTNYVGFVDGGQQVSFVGGVEATIPQIVLRTAFVHERLGFANLVRFGSRPTSLSASINVRYAPGGTSEVIVADLTSGVRSVFTPPLGTTAITFEVNEATSAPGYATTYPASFALTSSITRSAVPGQVRPTECSLAATAAGPLCPEVELSWDRAPLAEGTSGNLVVTLVPRDPSQTTARSNETVAIRLQSSRFARYDADASFVGPETYVNAREQSVTFLPGEALAKKIPITSLQDQLPERIYQLTASVVPDRTFSVFTPASPALPPSAEVSIVDDDGPLPKVRFAAPRIAIREGDNTEAEPRLVLPLSVSPAPIFALTVNVNPTALERPVDNGNIATRAIDTDSSQNATFLANQTTTTSQWLVVGDTTLDGLDPFAFAINPIRSDIYEIDLTANVLNVDVEDDECSQVPVDFFATCEIVAVSIEPASLVESDADSVTAEFQLALPSGSTLDGNEEVDYQINVGGVTVPGDAGIDLDGDGNPETTVTGTVRWAAKGEPMQKVSVSVLGDDAIEAAQTVTMRLLSGRNVAIRNIIGPVLQAQLQVLDDDTSNEVTTTTTTTAGSDCLSGPGLLLNGTADADVANPNPFVIPVNPISAWVTTGNFHTVAYSAGGRFPTTPVPNGCSAFFAGGDGPISTATQIVDLGGFTGAIDAGGARITLSGMLGGFASQDDSMTITATALDSSDASLGLIAMIGPVLAAERRSTTSFLLKSAEGGLPVGTRRLRVVMTATRFAGTYNDAFADNVTLTGVFPTTSTTRPTSTTSTSTTSTSTSTTRPTSTTSTSTSTTRPTSTTSTSTTRPTSTTSTSTTRPTSTTSTSTTRPTSTTSTSTTRPTSTTSTTRPTSTTSTTSTTRPTAITTTSTSTTTSTTRLTTATTTTTQLTTTTSSSSSSTTPSSTPSTVRTTTGQLTARLVVTSPPCCAPFYTVIDGRDSTLGDADAWVLDFGDGSVERGVGREIGVIHVYTNPGTTTLTRTVTLAITSTTGEVAQTTRDVIVRPPSATDDRTPPIARLGVTPTTTENAPAANPFAAIIDGRASSAFGGHRLTRWFIDFGDGQRAEGEITNEGAPEISVSHTFTNTLPTKKTFVVSLTVTDDTGRESLPATVDIVVGGAVVNVAMKANPIEGESPLQVDFDFSGTNGPISQYEFFSGEDPINATSSGNGTPPRTLRHSYRLTEAQIAELQQLKSATELGTLSAPVDPVTLSNGCGGQGLGPFGPLLNDFLNTARFVDDSTKREFVVNFTKACDMHDAGYQSAIVTNIITNKDVRDYSKTNQLQADDFFLADLRMLCDQQIPASSPSARTKCKGPAGVDRNGPWKGAQAYYDAVRLIGQFFYDGGKPVWDATAKAVRFNAFMVVTGQDGRTYPPVNVPILVRPAAKPQAPIVATVTATPTTLERGANGKIRIEIDPAQLNNEPIRIVDVLPDSVSDVTVVDNPDWTCAATGTDRRIECTAASQGKQKITPLQIRFAVDENAPPSITNDLGLQRSRLDPKRPTNDVPAGLSTHIETPIAVTGWNANAGDDKELPSMVPGEGGDALVAASIDLDGSATTSDGREQTFSWSQVRASGDPVVVIATAGAPGSRARFTAPRITAAKVLTFELTVNAPPSNGRASQTKTDRVAITLLPPPQRAPVITSLVSNRSGQIAGGTEVTLTLTATDADRDALTLAWTAAAGQPSVVLPNPVTTGTAGNLSSTMTFRWPDNANELTLIATVADGRESTRPNTSPTQQRITIGEAPAELDIALTANKLTESPPFFGTLEVVSGDTVVLTTGTTEEGLSITLASSDPAVSLTNAAANSSTELSDRLSRSVKRFVAPAVTTKTTYRFSATVAGRSGSGTVDVTVNSAPSLQPVVNVSGTGGTPTSANRLPEQVAPGASVQLNAVLAGAVAPTWVFRQVSGTTVSLAGTGAGRTFTAPSSLANLTFEATVTDGSRSGKTTVVIRVGEAPATTGIGCTPGSIFQRGVDWAVSRGTAAANRETLAVSIGSFANIDFGNITINGSVCDENQTLTFTGGSFSLFGRTVTAVNTSGTLTKDKVCFTAGQVKFAQDISDVQTNLQPTAGKQLCINLDPAKWASAETVGTLSNTTPIAVEAAKLENARLTTSPLSQRLKSFDVPECTNLTDPTITGTIEWDGLVPGLDPSVDVDGRTAVGFSCGGMSISFVGLFGDVPAPDAEDPPANNSRWLALGGVGFVTPKGAMSGRAVVLGAHVGEPGRDADGNAIDNTEGITIEGTISRTEAGIFDWAVEGQAVGVDLVPNVLEDLTIDFKVDTKGFEASSSGVLTLFAETPQALPLTFALKGFVNNKGIGFEASATMPAWPAAGSAPLPGGLRLPAGEVSALFERNSEGAISYELAISTSAPWAPTPQINLASFEARVSNRQAPDWCDVPAGTEWMSLQGVVDVAGLAPLPDASASLSACIAFGDAFPGGIYFTARADGAFDNWRPIDGQDFRITSGALVLTFTRESLSISVEGRANFRGLNLAARILVTTDGQLIVDAAGELASLGLPIASGHVLFALQAQPAYVPVRLESDLVDPEPVALEANTLVLLSDVRFADLDPNRKLHDLLTQALKLPESSVPQTLRILAKIGPAGFALEASIVFPGAGFELFRTCGVAATAANQNPCANSAPGLTTSLNGKSLTLKFDSSGTFGLKATTKLHLPSKDGTGTGSDLDVSLEASFNPVTQNLALALYFTGEWRDALGITDLYLQDMAIQGGLQIVPPPGVPIPTIGFGATVTKLPRELNDLLGIQRRSDGTQEKMSLVVNIAPTAPIFAIELGEDDGEIFLKPIAPISAANADVVQIDYAKLVIAPLGGTVGPYTFQPGLSLGFAAVIADVPVDVGATLTIIPPTLKANVDVGAISFSGVQLSNTHLKLDAAVVPPAFRFELDGGMALSAPGAPNFQARVLVDADITRVNVEASVNVRDWQIFPNVVELKQATFNLEANASISGTAALSLDGTGKIRVGKPSDGTLVDMAGALKLSGGGIDEISLKVAAPLNLPGLVVSGDGCEGLAGSTGACTYLSYKSTQSPPFDIGFEGSLDAAGRTANIVGKFGATGVSLNGDIDLAELGYVSVQGDVWFGSALPANLKADGPRPITGNDPFSAAPAQLAVQPWDWRLAGAWQATKPLPPQTPFSLNTGTFPKSAGELLGPVVPIATASTHPFDGSSLAFSAGSIGNTTWLQGRGRLAMNIDGARHDLASAMVTISNDAVAVTGKTNIAQLGQASFDGVLVLGSNNPTSFRGKWNGITNAGVPIESATQTALPGDFKLTGSLAPVGAFAGSNLAMSIGKLRSTAWFQGVGTLKIDNDPIANAFLSITESSINVSGNMSLNNPIDGGPATLNVAVDGTITYQPSLSFDITATARLDEIAVQLPVVLDGPPFANLIGAPGDRFAKPTTTFIYFDLELSVSVSSTGVSTAGAGSARYVEYFGSGFVGANGRDPSGNSYTPRTRNLGALSWSTAAGNVCYQYGNATQKACVTLG
jgi:PKD repeat protein